MDIAALSVAMSQSSVQQSAGIALTKIAMDAGEQKAAGMTEMLSNSAVDPNLGSHLDVMA
ncbi:YjfB family protein [Clostridium autoethanogenum]|uniref:YjfB family protein n=1 Tax=Clostridium autoethanogenum DSM 10061 TaxID=1341692 RepID=A0ABM5NXJ3_9CLOT|nr:YjfB family protein [Clostridium autoethanogenum]AGY77297.1 YjfB family protein [Clostridium autoethanogenum DSM 10061]ALU37439.1 putative motility protein [Clostridium autoethanogenum DSM 10061]OVY49086.1 hypothetical protein WX72_03858 [Clostridium autoethanogenum]